MNDINPGILPRLYPIATGMLKVGESCSIGFHGARYALERTGPGRFDLKATFLEHVPTPASLPIRYRIRRCVLLDFPCAESDSWQPEEYDILEAAMQAAKELGSRNGQADAIYVGWTGGTNRRGCTEFAVSRPGSVFGSWCEWELYDFGQPDP